MLLGLSDLSNWTNESDHCLCLLDQLLVNSHSELNLIHVHPIRKIQKQKIGNQNMHLLKKIGFLNNLSFLTFNNFFSCFFVILGKFDGDSMVAPRPRF